MKTINKLLMVMPILLLAGLM